MSPAAGAGGLTPGGWTFLALAWGGILGSTLYCFYRLLRTRDRRR